MADYTDLPNSAVGIGGIPSGTTATALRDNPIAIAEGAVGAPRVALAALGYFTPEIGSGTTTVSTDLTFLSVTDLDNAGIVRYDISAQEIDGATNPSEIQVRFSANNGSTWDAWQDVSDSFTENQTATGSGYLDLVAGTVNGSSKGSDGSQSIINLTKTANANAVQFKVNTGTGARATAFAALLPMTGRTAA